MLTGFLKTLKSTSQKIYWRETLACLFLIIVIYFFRKERHQVALILPYLRNSKKIWLLMSAAVTLVYVLLQAGMYVSSFHAFAAKIKWIHAVELFLKRNILGVFLPGGGVSALAYTPLNVRKSVEQHIKIHQASGLFAFAGIVSTFLIGLPVLFTNIGGANTSSSFSGLGIIALFILLILYVLRVIRKKGKLYQQLQARFPSFANKIDELTNAQVSFNDLVITVCCSVGVELCGIIHLYLAMYAAGAQPNIHAAGLAYIISLLLMVASPFLKGLGAVELSIVYILGQFGYPPVQGLAIAIIYRLFEFWLPMFLGIIAFLLKGKNVFIRIFPALAIFFLGIINVLSVITPPIKERLSIVRNLINTSTIHTTNVLVLFVGLALMVTARFLMKGLRNAWWIAVIISFLSIAGHLLKALDYEEAILAACVFTVLIITRDQYKLKTNSKHISRGIIIAALSFVAVIIYGSVGFYFLEKRHFGIDLSWQQSILYTVRGFLLLQSDGLRPLTLFGLEFLRSLNVLGFISWSFLLYVIIKPYLKLEEPDATSKESAQMLLEAFGNSTVDYFKVSDDKLIYISNECDGFVSYAVAGSFAIVLEEPVCALEDKFRLLKEFETYTRNAGLKSAFYRVDESSITYFSDLKKKKLLIGQEALLDVTQFELGGKSKKSLRNALNSLQKKGYTTSLRSPPHEQAFLDELKAVSDEWLTAYGRKELVFSQGAFNQDFLKRQKIIATTDQEGKIVAFLNIIPDFAPNECTYDLIRKKADAPGGCMDALIIELISYARKKGITYLNLGLVPMSGIDQPDDMAESIIKYAYEKFRRFRHLHGLREFKEKYASEWLNKYLIYSNDFDLIQLPSALHKVMQTA